MNIRITIKNALTNVVEQDFTDTVAEADVDSMHKFFREAYPNSFVNFKMDDGGFIAGQPYNMAKDEYAHEQGLITWNQYLMKWYPNLAN